VSRAGSGSTPVIRQDQLGVQAHCLRREMAADFSGTLERLAALGLTRIELCSFPGCAGNPWGDFGALATWEPARIREELERLGLGCVSCHFSPPELTDDAIDASIRWARGVGTPAVVLSGLPLVASSPLADWQSAFAALNRTGRRLREAGLGFAYHLQNDAWATVEAVPLFDELLRLTDPELCAIELDLSGALVYPAEPVPAMRANPGRFPALHLRDGKRPASPLPWLPSLALGEGDMDWTETIAAAQQAEVPYYLLEMEVEPPRDVFEAIETSLAWFEDAGLLGA